MDTRKDTLTAEQSENIMSPALIDGKGVKVTYEC